ncbi:Tubulin-tyrosine ligase family [Legionella lansingensis]|uniref:Tubulin-tyrosine ligase family protein n=1 Tax=Legionella lansingensis TaxID=45067 RepID=A0A0W0V7A4_9GAMM|nr:hypothetical protein [Legionella lansingensis]KTD16000.1 Tubulin-tyrosine ligase family protein [Legionella lansingensis]SNV56293.1 Tubulin-tyrosine ligase family [Legionella lansingensis]
MLKSLLKHRSKCYALKSGESPTHYNLHRYLQEQGWRSSAFNWRADFSDKNLQFHLPAAQCLEFKHLLAQLIEQYCPSVMPVTYGINDSNWPEVLGHMADSYYLQTEQYFDKIDNLVWILKPALLNNGREIKIFERLSDLEAHFLSSQRLGGEHVLQQYITEPHLLKPPNGHKYSIRMFVILTNYGGCYLYPLGYFNVALHSYMPWEFSDLRPHLTNEHLHEEEANVVQIPTDRFDFFHLFYPQIKTILTSVLKALQQQYSQAFICDAQRAIALFGFDFIVDKNQRLWLLEANHGPCFPVDDDHPLQKHLYYDFWQALIKSFVLPIANQDRQEEIDYGLFEKISTA